MALIETDEAARRLARAIASDLSLYNDEKVTEGIRNDTLFEVMEEEFTEGRQLYESRIAPELRNGNHYNKAIIDVLVAPKAGVPSPMW